MRVRYPRVPVPMGKIVILRLDRRRRKALAISQGKIVENGGQTIFTSDDDRWEDIWLDTSDQTSEDGDDDEDDDDDWE